MTTSCLLNPNCDLVYHIRPPATITSPIFRFRKDASHCPEPKKQSDLRMYDLWSSILVTLYLSNPVLIQVQDETKGARITKVEDYEKCLDYFQQQGQSSDISSPHLQLI